MPLTKLTNLASSNLDAGLGSLLGGITIGYSETFSTEWTRGWIERCRIYSAETIPTYP